MLHYVSYRNIRAGVSYQITENHRIECSIYARPKSGAAMFLRKYTSVTGEDDEHVLKILHCTQLH